ncbi:MAG: OmpA family protein [Desulfobacteraceae bacterium]|nr:OmpA family protein [Desulfobacteraceae bacterium]
MKYFYFYRVLVLFVCGFLFCGCGQQPLSGQQPLKGKAVIEEKSPKQALTQLGRDLNAARAKMVNLLSPAWFEKAETSYGKAKKAAEKNASAQKIMKYISKGRSELDQAGDFAGKSKYHLAPVIESRNKVIKAKTKKKVFIPLAKLEKDFIRLTHAVEDNDFRYIHKHKKKLSQAYLDLELQAIKGTVLDQARISLKRLQKKGVHKMVPEAYAQAAAKLKETNAYINANRYDHVGISARVADVEFYIQRAKHISKMAKNLQNKSPEAIALIIENYLHKVNESLDEPDHRNLSFDDQHTRIINSVNTLKDNYVEAAQESEKRSGQIKMMNQHILDLEGRTYEFKEAKDRLAAEKRFNALYNQVSAMFSNQEAEVYKKGRKMIIRMKSISFPVGSSVILPVNYSVLSKVQRAIHVFGEPDVTIEGHTDSTGSPANNKTLSRKRAEAVRQYFIANNVLFAEKISAQGFGAERPLVSNSTAKGRAINRRIDIVIRPVLKKTY